jgi:hypothetical protein
VHRTEIFAEKGLHWISKVHRTAIFVGKAIVMDVTGA